MKSIRTDTKETGKFTFPSDKAKDLGAAGAKVIAIPASVVLEPLASGAKPAEPGTGRN